MFKKGGGGDHMVFTLNVFLSLIQHLRHFNSQWYTAIS